MNFYEKLQHFQFTQKWIDLGIINADILEELWTKYQRGDDPNVEHYRWSAFRQFLENKKVISESNLRKFCDLALTEPDEALGASMLFELMEQKEFPSALLEELSQSKWRSVAGAAKKKIANRKGSLHQEK